jgi:hypothetical protein
MLTLASNTLKKTSPNQCKRFPTFSLSIYLSSTNPHPLHDSIQTSGHLGIISLDPSVSKSHRSHVDVFRSFFFVELRYILSIPLKQPVFLLKSWIWTGSFSNSSSSFVTSRSILRIHCSILCLRTCVCQKKHSVRYQMFVCWVIKVLTYITPLAARHN